MSFLFTEPTQLCLEISPEDQEEVWRRSRRFSTLYSCWQGYLNQLSIVALIPWLEEEYGSRAIRLAGIDSWEIVNGTAVELLEKRLILIPTEATDREELRVPQEWLDLPSWVGDYYLGIEVNLDEKLVTVWGYTTHQQLKDNGSYDPSDRTYCLSSEKLAQDLDTLWVTCELCPTEQTQGAIAPVPEISPPQAENLLQRLGNAEVILPRLEVPFSLWGALLEQPEWRERLYQQRQGRTTTPVLVHLSRWWENIVEAGWQLLEGENLAYGLRNRSTLSETEAKRLKPIHLANCNPMTLLVKLTPQSDDRVSIEVQLHPQEQNYLQTGVTLAVLSGSGKTLKSLVATGQDNFLQTKFKFSSGKSFSLQVALDEAVIQEDFLV